MKEWMEIRLDRAMVSGEWLDLFSLAKLYNLKGSHSDHNAIFCSQKLLTKGWKVSV